MPLLHWLTRDDDIHAAAQTPYRLLEEVASQSQGDRDAGNMLIQGDNLDALKALLPYYAGRVKCIFIDPPYNTRSAFEHYDDNLEHAQWLALLHDSTAPPLAPQLNHTTAPPTRVMTRNVQNCSLRSSLLASYQQGVWAIPPDTFSMKFSFAHGSEFVVEWKVGAPPTTRRSAHRRAVRRCHTKPGGRPIDGRTARVPPGVR